MAGTGQDSSSCLCVSSMVIRCSLSLSLSQNLDGGGSSVSVYKGKVISKPTCLDIHFICQRPVTSITCISNV